MQKSLNRDSLGTPARRGWLALALLFTGLAGGSVVHAQQTDDDDPISRVARLSYLQGDVSIQSASEDEDAEGSRWIQASLNRPLTAGDALSTGARGRAELQLGDVTIQVADDTSVVLEQLTDNQIGLSLDHGSVFVRLRGDEDDQTEIVTRNAQVLLRESGAYRITSWDEGVTRLQVRDGHGEVAGERQSYPVRAGEQLTLRGNHRVSVEYDDLPALDDFDRFAQARNERSTRGQSVQYVSRDVIGYEDLDDYGYWRYETEYGYVWSPTTVYVGWAPYRAGHWAWVRPWGWTWVDNAPWGFAPFHYGRWAYLRQRWCWVPGPRAVRAVYAPAMVAWVGTPSVAVSISTGPRVGWIPLGPRDVYRPYYRHSDGYARRVNLSNSRLSAPEFDRGYRRHPHEQDYRNRFATTVVPSKAFTRGQPVQGNVIKSDWSRLPVTESAPQGRVERPIVPRTDQSPTRTWSNPYRQQRVDGNRDHWNESRHQPMNPPVTPPAPVTREADPAWRSRSRTVLPYVQREPSPTTTPTPSVRAPQPWNNAPQREAPRVLQPSVQTPPQRTWRNEQREQHHSPSPRWQPRNDPPPAVQQAVPSRAPEPRAPTGEQRQWNGRFGREEAR